MIATSMVKLPRIAATMVTLTAKKTAVQEVFPQPTHSKAYPTYRAQLNNRTHYVIYGE